MQFGNNFLFHSHDCNSIHLAYRTGQMHAPVSPAGSSEWVRLFTSIRSCFSYFVRQIAVGAVLSPIPHGNDIWHSINNRPLPICQLPASDVLIFFFSVEFSLAARGALLSMCLFHFVRIDANPMSLSILDFTIRRTDCIEIYK